MTTFWRIFRSLLAQPAAGRSRAEPAGSLSDFSLA
jgi:hypothetical protein